MKVLIGCEESQTICRAFREAGHEAYSCDILPTRGNPDWHFQGDIMSVIPTQKWDLIILHPDCTAMAVSGNGTYGTGKEKNHERSSAIIWTVNLWETSKMHSDRVALENPRSVIFPRLRKCGATVQYVQPWMFGHPETKDTGFALHNLPQLVPTNNVRKEMEALPEKEKHKIWYMSPGPNRKRDRSVTYQGMAEAIVEQWGNND